VQLIQNRIQKNFNKLKGWSQQSKIEAYRLYDRDIPEYPFIIDRYLDYFLIYDRSVDFIDLEKNHLPEVQIALKNIFEISDEKIILKKRERQKGDAQYNRLDKKNEFLWIQESQARVRVNLHDFLDTGVFLDHRPMRQKIYKQSSGKRFLNLFCYTGVVSVFAGLAGANTTSVDMSATYLDWAKENFKGNGLKCDDHKFVQENCLEYLSASSDETFDIIFLDPPTFSNSKRMDEVFEVEKDQNFLVDNCTKKLRPGGTLYFSNNKRNFKLSDIISQKYAVKDISKESIPRDFHDMKIHQCFEIKTK
jgi:23S rRNA (cytosine1962-C5)-methyltransferase